MIPAGWSGRAASMSNAPAAGWDEATTRGPAVTSKETLHQSQNSVPVAGREHPGHHPEPRMKENTMQPVYFVEEKNPFGDWSPRLYYGAPPSMKKSEGGVRKFRRQPVQIAPSDVRFGLNQIASLYGGEYPCLGEQGAPLAKEPTPELEDAEVIKGRLYEVEDAEDAEVVEGLSYEEDELGLPITILQQHDQKWVAWEDYTYLLHYYKESQQ